MILKQFLEEIRGLIYGIIGDFKNLYTRQRLQSFKYKQRNLKIVTWWLFFVEKNLSVIHKRQKKGENNEQVSIT